MFCFVLFCFVLFRFVSFRFVLFRFVLFCFVSFRFVLFCFFVRLSALHCDSSFFLAWPCIADPSVVILSDRDQTRLKRALVGSGLFFGAVSGFFLGNLMSELKLTTDSTPFGDSTTILGYAVASELHSVGYLEKLKAKEEEQKSKANNGGGHGNGNGKDANSPNSKASADAQKWNQRSTNNNTDTDADTDADTNNNGTGDVTIVPVPAGPYFNVPLCDVPTTRTKYDGEVPVVLVALWKCIHSHLDMPGLFRISGDAQWYQPLVAALDAGGDIKFCGAEDAHIAASVMKLWLRNLKDSDKVRVVCFGLFWFGLVLAGEGLRFCL